ncbi:MAG: 2-oxoglutarate ferredoxin oxidoreductase subunit gamma [Clostridia bacterium]|jgi:2-oxoglutarate ferredoxin oxidoreductase subunit gamma|nr:2-oxoglutarate ferredoxin oxidoreductase subunit gamma [Clostridia bacterium]MDN5321953.1 2-oxoglutarate ferredoxin oxidoreductase subunit gamma [Clostridia bacterium]
MMDKVLLAGFGGQGVMFIGKIFAVSGMIADLNVCWIPSYGPEMRGGTANCSVILSDEEIHSPVIDQADGGIVLNQPSYEKFLGRIKPGGVLVINSSIVNLNKIRDDIKIIKVPATEIANELGNSSIANMVCLGALLPHLNLTDYEKVKKAIYEVVGEKKPELLELNLNAIKKGMEH